MSSRFSEEGWQEPYVAFVKSLTTKPVVGVGRFTSPDTMAGQIRRGVLDLIGAARPSIADPFLPRKIQEGRIDDIRECIGCNVCRSSNNGGVPIRCTQNPTMGEEWRRGWHPERIAPARGPERVLVIGAGPAGLEAARALGDRGYAVVLAEAGGDLGGRVAAECRLPGLAAWGREHDWRLGQIAKLVNVEVFRGSRMDVDDVLDAACAHVAIATGATWRRDGVGGHTRKPVPGHDLPHVLAPEDVMAGAKPGGRVVVYDDDPYTMGGCLAEKLALDGAEVTLVTPATMVSPWTEMTNEQHRVQARLIERGVRIVTTQVLAAILRDRVLTRCLYGGRETATPCDGVVLVTARRPSDALYRELVSDADRLASAGIATLTRIGDCLAPGTIAMAVYAGHRFAREFDAPAGSLVPRRERVVV